MYRRHTYRDDIAGSTWLYRLYAGAQLLYVGVSSDPRSRFVTHRRKKSWWRLVELRWFPTRAAAFAAERQAIAEHNPAGNVARPKVTV